MTMRQDEIIGVYKKIIRGIIQTGIYAKTSYRTNAGLFLRLLSRSAGGANDAITQKSESYRFRTGTVSGRTREDDARHQQTWPTAKAKHNWSGDNQGQPGDGETTGQNSIADCGEAPADGRDGAGEIRLRQASGSQTSHSPQRQRTWPMPAPGLGGRQDNYTTGLRLGHLR